MLCGQLPLRLLGHGPEHLLPGLAVERSLHHAPGNTEKGRNFLIGQPNGFRLGGEVFFTVPKVVDKLVKKALKSLHIELLLLPPGQARQLQDYPGQGGRCPEHGGGGGGREGVD